MKKSKSLPYVPPMEVIKVKKNSHGAIGIVPTPEWFGSDHPMGKLIAYKNSFVVGTWFEYSNGCDIKVEARRTLAMFMDFKDAVKYFNTKKI